MPVSAAFLYAEEERMVRKWLFRMAKSPWMGKIVGFAFQYMSRLIPVKRIVSNKEVFIFAHPQPCYPHHLILSPKRPVRSLQQLAAEPSYFTAIWSAAMAVHAGQPEIDRAFTLAANGGKRQEVQQVHFHMFTDHPLVTENAEKENGAAVFYQNEKICILKPAHPEWDIHLVIRSVSSARDDYLSGVLRCIDGLDAQFGIVQQGYSLVYQHNPRKNDQAMPVFHIVSGKKRA